MRIRLALLASLLASMFLAAGQADPAEAHPASGFCDSSTQLHFWGQWWYQTGSVTYWDEYPSPHYHFWRGLTTGQDLIAHCGYEY
jgi:hypothetical protein